MKGKICFFIGHRDAPESIYPVLLAAVEQHITGRGVSCFVVGQYENFDRLARKALIDVKRNYPHISILILMPYHPSEQSDPLPSGFDGSIYPEGLESVPRRYAIARANRYMIDHSDYIIAYVTHPASNACNLVEYAKKKTEYRLLNITNLNEKTRG